MPEKQATPNDTTQRDFGTQVCSRDWWERAVLKEFRVGEWREKSNILQVDDGQNHASLRRRHIGDCEWQ